MGNDGSRQGENRRNFIRLGLGAAAGLALPAGLAGRAFAADQPPLGTWPVGAQGNSVFIGIAVPRTGTYAVQGEDELKGWQLAVEHLNSGHPLMRQISTRTKKGVLGKEVNTAWPIRPPSPTTRCRPSSASSPRTRRSS